MKVVKSKDEIFNMVVVDLVIRGRFVFFVYLRGWC